MLNIRCLYKTFNAGLPDEVQALRGVDLRIAAGSLVVVIGSNGSGKSTLLSCVAGNTVPDKGSIELDGRAITRWPEYRRAQYIGRVFQNPFSGTAPHMTIAENLALATRRGHGRGLGWALSGRQRETFRERIRRLAMGLEDRMDNEIGSLSGGQRQALTLLMATWLKPRLLLLDEHTAALDPKTADQVIRLTQDVIAGDRLTTLMVTHSMHQAINLGDRLIMMHQGRIIRDFSGAAKQRLRTEDLLEQFNEVRRAEQLDPGAAQMLQELYV